MPIAAARSWARSFLFPSYRGPRDLHSSLHDALPIFIAAIAVPGLLRARMSGNEASAIGSLRAINSAERSEEHTSELQSRFDLVCRLLLEKKKKRYVEQVKRLSEADRYKISEATAPRV